AGVWLDAKIQDTNIGLTGDFARMITNMDRRYKQYGPGYWNEPPHGVLVIITPSDLSVTDDLKNEATQKYIHLMQMKAQYKVVVAKRKRQYYFRVGPAESQNEKALKGRIHKNFFLKGGKLWNGYPNAVGEVLIRPIQR